MIWFTLPWRSPHPVRKTLALVVLLVGIAGAVQPLGSWTWKVTPWILGLALLLTGEPSWPWRSPRPVYATVNALLGAALLLAGVIWGFHGLVWNLFLALLLFNLAVDALKPGPLWQRVVALILLVGLVVIGWDLLHVPS